MTLPFQHPSHIDRRTALQAGSVGLLGLGMNHLAALRTSASAPEKSPARAVIYIFLSGGLAQHESFDMKPEAPDAIRGEFRPIPTRTPGIEICEHLPRLAQRSHMWSLVRSLTHSTNSHTHGHVMMLTGRSVMPVGMQDNRPSSADWPSIAAIAGDATRPRNNLPPAVILPERLTHYSGRGIPGQFGGQMGARRDPWIIEAAPYDPFGYGAFPKFAFDHQDRPNVFRERTFEAPNLVLPREFGEDRLSRRLSLLGSVDEQRRDLAAAGETQQFDRHRQAAISLLTEPRVRRAIDVVNADAETLDRYGRNSFGWSLLMARRLVESGVNLVQVNLGNNETWDTHGIAFPHLRDNLFPPTDLALSALLDDLSDSGLLDSTLIVMAGEFGRTPRLSTLTGVYPKPGRDHWGAVQTVFFAGGGTRGGVVVGSSDKIGGYPAADPQTPETMAATIYHSLGIPEEAAWHDDLQRPHQIYYGEPIRGLLS